MNNSQLLQLLTTFSASERRELGKWVESPFFQVRAEAAHLFHYIDTHMHRHPEALQKEKAWEALFPSRKYEEKTMNYAMSWLMQSVRDYLAYREWRSDEVQTRLFMSKALRKKNAGEGYEKALDAALVELERLPRRDETYFRLAYQLQLEKYEYQQLQSRKGDIPIRSLYTCSLAAHRYSQLRLACYNEMLGSIRPDAALADEAIELPSITGIELYESMWLALRDPTDEPSFFRAKSLLKTCEALLSTRELRQIYLMALNYCIRQINSGKTPFMKEAFDLYRTGLESRVLFENGVLSRFTYHNAVTAGLYEFAFDWVRDFIENYRIFLPARDRHQAYQFNLATYYFRLPDYDAALSLLRNTDFDFDTLASLNARSMLLRIYYEKKYHEALLSLLDSFQAYIRRHPDIGYQQENYLNLVRFVRRMLRESPMSEAAKTALRQDIAATNALAERRWLLEQLGDKR